MPGLDPTPFALAVTGLAFAWGIFRLRLFDIVPVVHEALPENLREWREQVLDNILNGVLVFGLLALAGGINNVIQAYRQVASLYDRPLVLAIAIITAYVTATLAVFIAAFWRGPGYTWRAGTLLSVFYGLGALGLALSGLSGDGRLFLFAFVILTAILFGLRRGLGALALSVLTFATTAWLLVNGVIQIPGLRQANSTDPSAWLSGGLVFVLLAVGAVTSVTYLMQRLEHGLIQTQSELAERQRAEAALRASEARLQRLNGVLRAISAINQLIVRERDRERLLAEACQIFIRERDYAFVWIGLLGADGVTVHLAAASGPADPAHFHFRLDEPGHGPACAPAALRARTAFRVEPSSEDDPCPNCPLRARILQRSSVALPLALGEHVYGVVVLHAPIPNFFDAEETQLLRELADDLAYALEKLGADEQRRAREGELASLLDAARAVSTRLDPDEVLQQLAHSMTRALRLESCTLSAYDPETRGTLTLVHFSTLGESDTNDVGHLYPLADYPATARAIEQDEALIVRAGDSQADPAEVTLLRRLGLAVLLMFPLRVGGRVVGLAELYTRDEGREFAPAELRLARTLADQAAVALENARLFSETQTKATELSRLYAAAQDMTTSLESPRLLELLAKHLVKALDATSAYIGSVDVNQVTETMMAEYWAEAATPAERTSDLGRTFSLRHYATVLQAALIGQTIALQADGPGLSETE
ncbi:MAG: GAF domain-containing protein, partial [Chloroflexota bacterium]